MGRSGVPANCWQIEHDDDESLKLKTQATWSGLPAPGSTSWQSLLVCCLLGKPWNR